MADGFATLTLLDIPVLNWVLALLAGVASYVAMRLGLRLALGRARRAAQHTSNDVDDILVDVLGGTSTWLLALTALLIALGLLELPPRWASRVSQLWFLTVALQVGLWTARAIRAGVHRYVLRHASPGMPQTSASATLVSWGLHFLLWTVVVLAMLSNMGVDITAFVASLGIGGVAVALAVQNILGDLFASLSIAVDKPFEVGDFIVVGPVSGTVEHVGLKSTRIRSLSGEQVVMSNTDLLKQTINNYKRLAERRIAFTFRVAYDTTPEQAERIPALVRRIVEAEPRLRFDRAHLLALGESSLDYEVVYIVLDADYNLYMDIQQRINLALLRELGQLGVRFAFPTRTVVLARRTAGGRPGVADPRPTP